MMTLLRWFSLANRNHPMPHQMEGLKIAERVRIDNRKLFRVIILAAFVAIVAGLWAALHTQFKYGAENARVYLGDVAFRGGLEGWLVYPGGPNWPVMANVAQGFLVVGVLSFMRSRFLWWPLHPVGYVMGTDHITHYLWFPFFVAWATKSMVLRIGGLHAYRRTIPIAVGVILGEFASMTAWSLIGIALGQETYSHFIHPNRT